MGFHKTKTNAEKMRSRKREKNSGSKKRWRSVLDRHAMRRSILGRQTEDRVAVILDKKQKQGELISFVRHPAFSPEDMAGKDFTVSKTVNGEIVTTSFGITISPKPQGQGDISEIIVPPEMGDERIWYRICQICKQ